MFLRILYIRIYLKISKRDYIYIIKIVKKCLGMFNFVFKELHNYNVQPNFNVLVLDLVILSNG
jgi:hypothetical protein